MCACHEHKVLYGKTLIVYDSLESLKRSRISVDESLTNFGHNKDIIKQRGLFSLENSSNQKVAPKVAVKS